MASQKDMTRGAQFREYFLTGMAYVATTTSTPEHLIKPRTRKPQRPANYAKIPPAIMGRDGGGGSSDQSSRVPARAVELKALWLQVLIDNTLLWALSNQAGPTLGHLEPQGKPSEWLSTSWMRAGWM